MALTTGERRRSPYADLHVKPYPERHVKVYADSWPRAKKSPRSPSTWRSARPPNHRWRAQYGALKADDVKRLKELESEIARLERIVADKELQIEALKELGRGDW
jgi:hypothetical protein